MIIEAAERHTEQETRTRARVLAAVSERGPISASAIGRLLGLTPAGVRRHLEALAEQGAVSERDPVAVSSGRGRGRPAREWVVAEAGHASLPSGYDDLAAHALRFLRDSSGPDAVASFARARSADLEARYAADLAVQFRVMDYVPTGTNLVISNVSMGTDRYEIAGVEVTHVHPLSPLSNGQGMFVTTQGYRGHLDIGVTSCPALMPDVQEVVDAMVGCYDRLCALG